MPHPPVTLTLGPAGSGKTHSALTRYGEYLDGWRASPAEPLGVWIAPTPSALSDTRDRLANHSSAASLHVGMLTFAMLADEILARGRVQMRALSTIEKHRVLERIVANLHRDGRLHYFATVAEMPGFIRQIATTIADLKRRGINAEQFQATAHNARDLDVASIFAVYEKHLAAHKLFDAEGRFIAACEVLRSPTTVLGGGGLEFGMVVVDGFADFTSSQHELLRLLAGRCLHLIITLPTDHSGGQRELLFDKPRRTLDRLKQSFPQLNIEKTDGKRFQSAGLQFIERHLFQDEPESAQPAVEGLAVIAANTESNEIREVARRVKQLILSGQAQPGDVAVIFPSVADVSTRVDEIFSDFGLPTVVDHRPALATSTCIRTVSKLLELTANDWPFETLLEVIGNRFVQKVLRLEFPDAIEQLAAVERGIRRAQLPSGKKPLIDQLRRWAEPQAPRGDQPVAGSSESSSTPMSPAASAFDSRTERTTRDARVALTFLERLDKVLSLLPVRAMLADWQSHLEILCGELELPADVFAEQWAPLRQNLLLIGRIDETFSSEPMVLDVRQFAALVDSTARQVLLPKSVDPVGRIRVLSAESARNLTARHVFLAGLSEASYSSAEGSFQLYREQDFHRLTGDTGENLAERQAGETMLLFYDMVTRASETLTFSYTALDEKGQSLPPSPYLTEVNRCLSELVPTYSMPAGEVLDTAATHPLAMRDMRLNAVGRALDGDRKWLAGLVSQPSMKSIGQAILRGLSSVASRSNRDVFGAYEGILLGDAARAAIARRFNSEHFWSPSQLEEYATCPYKFFAKYLLRIEPLEDIALKSDYMRRGSLLHQVLAAVHSQCDSATPDSDLSRRFTRALEEIIGNSPLKGLERALLEIEYRQILEWAEPYAEQELAYGSRWKSCDSPPVPTFFEVGFGPKARSENGDDTISSKVPFTLDLGAEQIKLTGQIDRIDVGQVGGVTVFNIIDYKSGSEVKLSDKEILAGRQLQLPLYALAAEKLLLADKKAVAWATGYWSIKAKGFASGREATLEFRAMSDGTIVDTDRWKELEPEITQRIAEIIQSIRAGEFPMHNEDIRCTSSCDYSKVCRIGQIRSLEKTWIPSKPQPDRGNRTQQ